MDASSDTVLPDVSAHTTAVHAPEQRKKPIVRSRNGCLVCRTRRVKCDTAKPHCANCQRYGAECTWPKPFRLGHTRPILSKAERTTAVGSHRLYKRPPRAVEASAGCLAGSAINSSSTGIQASSSGLDHTLTFGYPASLAVLDDVDRFLALCNNTRMSSFFSHPTPAPDFLRWLFPVNEDLRCFHHCITYTLSIIVTTRLFLAEDQGVLGGNAIKNALLYLGAVHLSYLQGRDGDPGEGTETRGLALRYRSTTLYSLRMMLEGPAELLHAAYFSAAALVLTADLLAAQPRWRQSIRLARKGIAKRGGCAQILSTDTVVNPALKCAIESLVNLSLCCTLSSAESYIILGASDLGDTDNSWWNTLELEEITNPNTGRFEASCGVSRGMMQMFSKLVSLLPARGTLVGNRAVPDDSFSTSFLDWTPDIALAGVNERTVVGSLAFWHAGKILIWVRSRGVDPSDPQVQFSVSEIFRVCGSVGDKVEYLNWPIVIASWALRIPSNRDIARNLLKSFVIQCCYEIEVIQTLVEVMWTRLDSGEDVESCDWSEILVDLGSSVVLG